MLRLTSSDLPESSIANEIAFPVAQIWDGDSRSTAPLFRYNPFAHYGDDPGFTTGSTSLGQPEYLGHYFKYQLPSNVTAIASEDFSLIGDPLIARPGQMWQRNGYLNFYGDRTNSSLSTVVRVVVATTLPLLINNAMTIPLDGLGAFDAVQVRTGGLIFSAVANPGSPQTGEFVQNGDAVVLYPAPPAPAAFSAVEIEVDLDIEVDAIAMLAAFDLSATDLAYIDAVTFFGLNYLPAQRLGDLSIGQFMWQMPWLSLVMPIEQGRSLTPRIEQSDASTSSIGVLGYDSWQ